MYKIYVNDTPVFLVNTSEASKFAADFDQKLSARYMGNPKFLLQYIDMLEKTDRYDAIIIYHTNTKKLFKDFKRLFKRINAAGGAVFNPNNKLLAIYRLKYWDLPKGKIDEGEKKKKAAIREVQEETGIQDVKIVRKLNKTLHTYRLENGKRILKYTYWYVMKTSDTTLIPQTEEHIEEAKWIEPEGFINKGLKTYGSIRDVISSLSSET